MKQQQPAGTAVPAVEPGWTEGRGAAGARGGTGSAQMPGPGGGRNVFWGVHLEGGGEVGRKAFKVVIGA